LETVGRLDIGNSVENSPTCPADGSISLATDIFAVHCGL
jgi:hypothetical protein